MTREQIESRISSALEVATNKDEARSFVADAIGGERFQNLRITWTGDGYRCADVRWFDQDGIKQDLTVDVDRGSMN